MGVLAWRLARQSVWGLVALEAGFVVSAIVGAWLVDRLLRAHALVRESAQLLEESDYTTRFRATGQAEIDRLIEIYNRMADALRAERVRVREQHHFLQSLLDVSPSGAVILDHDAACGLPQSRGRAAARARRASGTACGATRHFAARRHRRPRPCTVRGRHARGRTPREGQPRHVHGPRVQPHVPPDRGADRGTAAGREGRVREADPHAVARGEQLGGGLELAADVLPGARRAVAGREPHRPRRRAARRDEPDHAAGRFHEGLRRRRPIARAPARAVRPARPARAPATTDGRRGRSAPYCHRDGAGPGPDRSARSDADGTGAASTSSRTPSRPWTTTAAWCSAPD